MKPIWPVVLITPTALAPLDPPPLLLVLVEEVEVRVEVREDADETEEEGVEEEEVPFVRPLMLNNAEWVRTTFPLGPGWIKFS